MWRRVLQTLSYATYAWLTTSLVLAAAVLLFAGMHGKLVAVQTNSMRPTFEAGDALLLTHIAMPGVRTGDVITYHNPQNAAQTISHRVVRINSGSFIAEGDAQHLPSPPIPSSAIVGRAVAVAPYLGTVITWLHSRLGLLVACYLPATAIIASELWRFSKLQSHTVYHSSIAG